MEKDLVSIIIPTHQGAEDKTRRLIGSIMNSDYHHTEIIVVNEGKERSAQRNIGIDRARGEFLFFPDSDWVIDFWLISDCVFMMSQCDAVYIPERIVTPGPFAKIRDWERQFYTGTCIDVVRFVKASNCPRFDESMSGPEDTDWDRRIGGVRAISIAGYFHMDGVGMAEYFKKKAYYARSMAAFEAKHKGDKILDWQWRCLGVFIENGKWKRLLKSPHLVFCVALSILVRGIIYKWGTR